jgi:adenine-specific DNA-methyltransferase
MRYIGNKTRLLPFIRGTLRRLGIAPGVAHDAFAGTAAVGRALKLDGWRVLSSDVMTYSYVLQRAYVVASRTPSFADLAAADPAVRQALGRRRASANTAGRHRLEAVGDYLARELEPETGFVTGHFAPAGGRMYFTDDNARRIDAVRAALHRWRTGGLISDEAYYLLLAALLEGADRVANTAGVYAAWMKRWQPNALRPLTITPEPPVRGALGASANLADAAAVARQAGPIDLLYLDPPYNGRQYAGYYHVPELIARGWFDVPPTLRGKTGLPVEAPGHQRSPWCSSRTVGRELKELLAATGARHVLVSYNSEGILPARELRDALQAASAEGRVRRFGHSYRRYRSDSDGPGRRYRGDEVREYLFYARLR